MCSLFLSALSPSSCSSLSLSRARCLSLALYLPPPPTRSLSCPLSPSLLSLSLRSLSFRRAHLKHVLEQVSSPIPPLKLTDLATGSLTLPFQVLIPHPNCTQSPT